MTPLEKSIIIQMIIGLISLIISNVFYFFYFNIKTINNDRPFLISYLQSISYVIISLLFCIFESTNFKLIKNKKNVLFYSPFNQPDPINLFEMKRLRSNNVNSFLTEPIYQSLSDDNDDDDDVNNIDEDDEQLKLKYQDKVKNYDDYLIKINENYNEMTKEDLKAKKPIRERRVKFSKKKEIRYLSYLNDIYAKSAILSRLSHETFEKLNYQLLNLNSSLSISNTIIIVPFYALIRFLSIFFTNLSLNYYFQPNIGYFDLNTGFSLLFIIIIQKFYFINTKINFFEKITFTKTIICLFSLLSLYLIKLSINVPFLNLTTTSNSIFINQTILNDSNIVDLFSFKLKSIIYTLLSSFLSTLFIVSLRNKYDDDEFDIKIFSSFLSLFTAIIFGILLIFVINCNIINIKSTTVEDLITFLNQSVFLSFGEFFLVIGCIYTNTMISIAIQGFLLPINYYSTNYLNLNLFLLGTLLLLVSFLILIYVTFYELIKRKDILLELFRKKFNLPFKSKKYEDNLFLEGEEIS